MSSFFRRVIFGGGWDKSQNMTVLVTGPTQILPTPDALPYRIYKVIIFNSNTIYLRAVSAQLRFNRHRARQNFHDIKSPFYIVRRGATINCGKIETFYPLPPTPSTIRV